MSTIILYTTPTCVFCGMVKEFFKEHKIKFKEIDVTKIFQKYHRQQEEIFGLGIGLELVQSICKKNDISIIAGTESGLFCMKMELPQIK